MSHFQTNFIKNSCIIQSIHELFVNVNLIYWKKLEGSISELYKNGTLKEKPRKDFYNYIILDTNQLSEFYRRFDTDELCMRTITLEDLEGFKKCIIYIGKGCGKRKLMHLIETEKMLMGISRNFIAVNTPGS